MRAVIHVNNGTQWQPKYGAAILAGLQRLNIDARITHNQSDFEQLTFVLGPNWALAQHKQKDFIFIDRAFWGDPKSVSIFNWRDGKKFYDWTPKPGRYHPELQPMKNGNRELVLCDYREPPCKINGVTVRYHPGDRAPKESLAACLARHDIARGGHSTALVNAALAGLVVHSSKIESPIAPISGQTEPNREAWAQALSWHNWTFDEIYNGEPWPHMIKSLR